MAREHPAPAMRQFEFFIEDDRFNVPTIEFVTVKSVERARELARERLVNSRHHTRIEVREGDDYLFTLSLPLASAQD